MASTSGLLHFIWYMLAVGPPRSETTPLNDGSRRLAQLFEHRFGRTRLDNPPWCAVIEQNVQPPKHPHQGDGVLDDLVGRDLPAFVHRVRIAGVGKSVDAVHVFLTDRQRRRVADDGLAIMELNQGSGVERVGFLVDDLGRSGKLALIGGHLLADGRTIAPAGNLATRWPPSA